MPIQGIGYGQAAPSPGMPSKGTDIRPTVNPAGKALGQTFGVDPAVRFAGVTIRHDAGPSQTLSTVAENIRVADMAMGNINDFIAKMKESTGAIVKMYPPYPPGSEERVQFLKDYSGFRKQIEQLTIPPEYAFAVKIVSDPSTGTGGDQTVSLGAGQGGITIRNQAVHPGPGGLDIPDLSVQSSDAEVAAAYEKLSSAAVTVRMKQETLASDAYALARSIEFADFPTQITEHDALEQSMALQQGLAQSGAPITSGLGNSLAGLV